MSRLLLSASILLVILGGILALAGRVWTLPDLIQFSYRAFMVAGLLGSGLGWALRRRLGEARADAAVANLCLAAAVCAGGLVAAELAARLAFRDVTTTADIRSWFAKRWDRELRLNSMGYRESEPSPWPAPGTYRIAAVGDSFTFGQGIDASRRYTDLLEGLLNQASGPAASYEVLNFGRRGAETEDHLEILREDVLRFHPDFVLLQWYENDVEGRDKSLRPRPLRLLPSDTLTGILRGRSALHFLLERQWAALQRRLGWVGSYQDYMMERFGDPGSPGSRRARRWMLEIIGACREAGVPMGIVLFPDFGGRTDLGFLRERVLEICAEEEIPCLDLVPLMPPDAQRDQLWASRLDPHPGALPNRIAAEALLESFGPLWGLPGATGDEALVPPGP